MMKRLLLGIDLQNDFCHPEGALYVEGATDDLQNIIRLLENAGDQFSEIIISMDSHFPIHIAHATYWKNEKGEHPASFSNITYEDAINQRWIPQYFAQESLHYLKTLSENSGYQNTIWPPHCLIGTKGWAIPSELYRALSHWALQSGKNFELYNKGSNPFTEHYSILKAAVEFEAIPSTCIDQSLLERFTTFNEIVIVGEAMDFCVASTILDLIKSAPEILQNLIILTDCMSNIIPNNETAETIYEMAQKLGAKMMRSDEYLRQPS